MKDKGDNRKIFDDYFRDFGGEDISYWSDEDIEQVINKLQSTDYSTVNGALMGAIESIKPFLPDPIKEVL
jgi:hypothetical protein